MTRVVCRELTPIVGDLSANLKTMLSAFREAVQAGADVVIMPELMTSGYVFDSREEAAGAAIGAADEVFYECAGIAATGPAVLVFGFCERGDAGHLYNSAAVVDSSGLRVVYRKTHLWDSEKLVFEFGRQVPPVVDTVVGRIGVLICYDLEFPEMTRYLALAGADLIAVPTNWPIVPRPARERPSEVTIAMAAARVNRVAIACCDRRGTERGIAWIEGTTIVDADGWIAATGDVAGWASAELDLYSSRDKKLSDRNDAFADRRPELYSAIVAGTQN